MRGQVSPGFIRECLGEEYKQKIRIANARKQKRPQQEPDPIDDLAKATTPNQEAEKKKVIMLGVDGQAMLTGREEDDQVDEGEDEEQSTITTEPSTTKDGVQTITDKSSRKNQTISPILMITLT